MIRWMRAPVIMAAVLARGGCALPATPLSNIEAVGRTPATVDADKLACWQEAEAAHPLTGALIGMRAALGLAAYAVESHRNEERERNERIERAAEGAPSLFRRGLLTYGGAACLACRQPTSHPTEVQERFGTLGPARASYR